jgi:hypothetical protein
MVQIRTPQMVHIESNRFQDIWHKGIGPATNVLHLKHTPQKQIVFRESKVP